MSRIVFGIVLVACGGIATPSQILAQDWAKKMFPEATFNFGVVARAAKTEHRFKFTNLYRDDVHITGVRASCGCTTPIVTKDTLKSYEQGEIIAHFNTDRFLGQRGATLTVMIDRPQIAEVQLRVDGYIRSDVVVSPGGIDLGNITQGVAANRQVTIDYAGRPDWKILEVRTGSPYIEAQASELGRQGSQVRYKIEVRLKDNTPPGYINDQLTLVTNDSQSTQFPVEVEGRVLAELTVSPSSLMVGAIPAGQKITRQLVVQSKKPFRVVGVSCENPAFEFRLPSEAKNLHLIPVTFVAGATPGRVSQKIRIETDLGQHISVEVPAFAEVMSIAKD
jgi:hypothetical protein